MSLRSVTSVLRDLQTRQEWQAHKQFQVLLRHWPEIVGTTVAQQTRPLSISPQGVLRVATSSSVWAQNLSFSRTQILFKLNQKLAKPLQNLYFSPAQWQEQSLSSGSRVVHNPFGGGLLGLETPARPHPNLSTKAEVQLTAADAQSAFQAWAKKIQLRSQRLPLCPRCQCPTPKPELDRWSVCNLCAVRN